MIEGTPRIPDLYARYFPKATERLAALGGDETTVRFWQEIYDENGRLTEIHEKYPVDMGHQRM